MVRRAGCWLAGTWILGAAIGGCTGGESTVPEGPPLRPVRYEQVSEGGGDEVRAFSGIARAGMESTLSFKVPGTVARLPVKVGDEVARGTLIAAIDPKDFQLQLENAEAAVERAKAEARNAEASYGRVRGMYEDNNASKRDLDAARAASESASAQVKTIESQLELARRQLAYTRLAAPNTCRVAAVYADENENVGAGQKVALVTCGDEIELAVSVPDAHIAHIKAGSRATVRFDALPGRVFQAKVSEVGVAATGGAPTYPVSVTLLATDPAIRPGMAGEARIRMTGIESHIRIPSAAVGEDREGRFVYVLADQGDGTAVATRRSVTLGALAEDGIAITSGLTPGELVVTAGVSRITDGQKVRLPDSASGL